MTGTLPGLTSSVVTVDNGCRIPVVAACHASVLLDFLWPIDS